MGYSLSWIATRDIAPEEVRSLLGIRALAMEEPLPESTCTAALLESGWYLVFFADGCDSVIRRAKNLIAGAPEALTLFVEEHVMASGLTAWKHGEKIWSVEHQGDEDVSHLNTQGIPPGELAEIVSSHQKQQEAEGGDSAGVDLIFEIPIVLAERLTGFRHDGDDDDSDHDPWYVCEIPSLGFTGGTSKIGCLPMALLAGAGIVALVTNKFS